MNAKDLIYFVAGCTVTCAVLAADDARASASARLSCLAFHVLIFIVGFLLATKLVTEWIVPLTVRPRGNFLSAAEGLFRSIAPSLSRPPKAAVHLRRTPKSCSGGAESSSDDEDTARTGQAGQAPSDDELQSDL
jgi:hypothetical protein